MTDFLIIGAGVSGLLLARELLSAGASVCVLDKAHAGKEASWAGGGIVSPLYPWRYSEPVTALANYAQAAYPALARELLDETGIDPQLRTSGLLMLDAHDQAEALSWAESQQRNMQAWNSSQIYQHEPGIAPGSSRALWMPEVANIRNPRLMQALRASVLAAPRGRLLEHAEVLAVNTRAGEVSDVQINHAGTHKALQAGQYIVAAGAWSGQLLAGVNSMTQAPGTRLPLVKPVKGEMLLYQTDKPLLHSIVLSKGRYLIPRADNLVLAGSTLEHCGFDQTVSNRAYQSLSDSAVGMIPALAGMPVVGHWAGLRPGAPAGVPYIGRLPGFTNLSINAGHYRNGLVLAPAAARLMADILLQRTPALDPAAYDPSAVRAPDPAFS